MDNNYPQLDIITLTKNSESTIHLTTESVSQQNYPHINHIIVDGNSQDGTLEFLHKFKHSKNLEIYTDANGISAGFNTGIKNSSGDLILFLNAGDYLVNESVIAEIVISYNRQNWLWAFGETISISKNKLLKKHRKQYEKWSQDLFLLGNPICHQSTVYSRKLINMIGLYDDLALEMDYDFNIRANCVSPPYLMSFPISYYQTTGISSVRPFLYYKYHIMIRKKYFPMSYEKNLLLDIKEFFKAIIRWFLIPIKMWL